MAINRGDLVRFTDKVYCTEFRGLTGVVRWIIETRGIAIVRCENGERYDTLVENLELISKEE